MRKCLNTATYAQVKEQHVNTVPEPTAIDGVGLNAVYRRTGSGEPMLFIGGPYLTGIWLDLYASLSAEFDLIVPDPPGFGSTPLPEPYDDMTDAVVHFATLLDVLGTGPVHVVGHGFGGWLAAELAALHPERIRSLSLLAPWGLRPDPDEPMTNIFRTTDDEELDLALGSDAEAWKHQLLVDDPGAQLVRSFQERTAIARVAWNPRYDLKLLSRLPRLTAPAVVLVPDDDRIVAPSVARQYASVLGAPLVRIHGDTTPTEHLFILQEPEQVAGAIVQLKVAEEPV